MSRSYAFAWIDVGFLALHDHLGHLLPICHIVSWALEMTIGAPCLQVPVNINKGITDAEAEKVVKGLAPKKATLKDGMEQVKKLYKLFTDTDCTLVEVLLFTQMLFWSILLKLTAFTTMYRILKSVSLGHILDVFHIAVRLCLNVLQCQNTWPELSKFQSDSWTACCAMDVFPVWPVMSDVLKDLNVCNDLWVRSVGMSTFILSTSPPCLVADQSLGRNFGWADGGCWCQTQLWWQCCISSKGYLCNAGHNSRGSSWGMSVWTTVKGWLLLYECFGFFTTLNIWFRAQAIWQSTGCFGSSNLMCMLLGFSGWAGFRIFNFQMLFSLLLLTFDKWDVLSRWQLLRWI